MPRSPCSAPPADRRSLDSLARRRVLARLAGTGGLIAAATFAAPACAQWKAVDDPFTLGVASGDPAPDGFVIWTRLAPQPLGGGMPPQRVAVEWLIAEDEAMSRVVRRGSASAEPELGHSVHVEVEGLLPERWYWYRFIAGGAASPVGRARTAPAVGAPVAALRFAYVSCQNFEHGHYAGYLRLAEEELDLVVHLGDYIYENSSAAEMPRRHDTGKEPVTLAEYRDRHAWYKTDASLRLAHQRFTWAVTWDDHEVENDYAADQSENRDDPKWFLERRAAAYQAYYEHLPLRRASLPRGPDLLLYRRLAFGDLATFHLLDNRQYRSDQVCGEGRRGGGNVVEKCSARLDPALTMWGATQEQWLDDGLRASRARWNVLAQSLMMGQFRARNAAGNDVHWTDGWDGYAHARSRFLQRIAEIRVSNPVSIGGDIHSYWANELKPDFDDERSPVVATEFVGTSMSSRGTAYASTVKALPLNPHVKFFESRLRGYVRCEVTPARWRTAFRAVERATDPRSPVRTLAAFSVENGRPQLLID